MVDYLGLAQDLKKALATYTESGGKGKTALKQEEAVAVMLEKCDVCCSMFHGVRLDEVDYRFSARAAEPASTSPGTHSGTG